MTAIALVVVAGCGAAPNQPVLANAPRPNPAAVAGVAAGAAAAITLADPDAASRGPEKKQDVPKKEIQVKENVPADVLDRMDQRAASNGDDANATTATATTTTAKKGKPARGVKVPLPAAAVKAEPTGPVQPKDQPAGAKTKSDAPKDALDFSAP
jgi:hypothetical protein